MHVHFSFDIKKAEKSKTIKIRRVGAADEKFNTNLDGRNMIEEK